MLSAPKPLYLMVYSKHRCYVITKSLCSIKDETTSKFQCATSCYFPKSYQLHTVPNKMLSIAYPKHTSHSVIRFYALLPPANEVCEGYVFTGVCLSTWGGHAWFYLGGVRGFLWGGHAWFSLGGGGHA